MKEIKQLCDNKTTFKYLVEFNGFNKTTDRVGYIKEWGLILEKTHSSTEIIARSYSDAERIFNDYYNNGVSDENKSDITSITLSDPDCNQDPIISEIEPNREDLVANFNKMCGQKIAKNYFDSDLDLISLGMRLIFEEFAETVRALGLETEFKNLCNKFEIDKTLNFKSELDQEIEIFDGLCDTQYTLSWWINVIGFSKVFDDGFKEVCRSNDSKSLKSYEDALEAKKELNNKYTNIEIKKIGDATYILLDEDNKNKIIKPNSYSPANLKLFVEELNKTE